MSKYLKSIGLQFFADPPADPAPTDPPPSQDPPADPTPAPKTFTQEEVTRMLANEKRQGRNSVLKDLGIDPEAKDGVKAAKAVLDSHKTQKQLDDEALTAEKEARSEAEKKATAAERKYTLLTSGCKKEFVEEVMALASAKVNDTTDFEAAVKAVKEKCPSFFEEDEGGDKGTGGGQGHKRQNNKAKPGDFGARLAQGIVSSNPKENPYFNN